MLSGIVPRYVTNVLMALKRGRYAPQCKSEDPQRKDARGRTRTGTPLLARDFKSLVSTISPPELK